jgi:hypothetical protein
MLEKSSIQRFQRKAPTTVVSTSKALLADVQPSLQKLQNQLDTQANAGYRLNWLISIPEQILQQLLLSYMAMQEMIVIYTLKMKQRMQ